MNETKQPEVSAIVLNHNGKDIIPQCIDSLIDQTYKDIEIIVVDNGSTDGSDSLVAKRYPDKVKLIKLDSNLGYAGGCNAGIRAATGRWIALLNNDAVADPRWIAKMLARIKNDGRNDAGMVASRILLMDSRDILDNTGHLIYPDGLNVGRGRLQKDYGQYEAEDEALFPSGCAALYSKQMLEMTGLFDEKFFAYADDTDLGLRGRLMGYRCLYANDAIVYHMHSATAGQYSSFKAFHVERNRIWVLIKIFPLSMVLMSPWYSFLRYCHQAKAALTGSGASGRFVKDEGVLQLAAVLIRALISSVSGIPGMLKERGSINNKRSLTQYEMKQLLKKYSINASNLARLG